ncbi:MAG: IS4/IS5 family transposase [Gloeocapsa sp. DLM2.Bin57]|nr:MAG: IS4/IS5 family transposase [Gloeocapsa sp. DLM2.Bin57]
MSFSHLDYCQYLLTSPKNYTLTNLAKHQLTVSHDTINKFLRETEISSAIIWENVRPSLKEDGEASLVFDDTVLDKRFSNKIELVRKQYSGNEHRVIKGIGVISCLYVNQNTGEFWVIDYRLYNPDEDGKTKLNHLEEMLLDAVNEKEFPFARVLMDSWYASQKIMALIDNLGKKYYCPLKINRLVDDSLGTEKYKRIDQLVWNNSEIERGKTIKINKFPPDHKVKLFRVTISPNRTEYIATNERVDNSTQEIKDICSNRWKIEEFHREIKQITGIESCQCRKAIIQKNHIACAFLVWNHLKRLATITAKTVYELKNEWFSVHLTQELKSPSIPMKLVRV